MTKLQLNDKIVSVGDVKQIIAELEEFKKVLSHNAIKAQVNKLKPKDDYDLSLAAKEIITDWNESKPLNIELLEQIIKALNECLNNSPRVIVTLAALPNNSLKSKFAIWFRKNVANNLLIDFNYNSALFGGLVVSIGSHTFDWSFRRQILDSKDKLAKAINNV